MGMPKIAAELWRGILFLAGIVIRALKFKRKPQSLSIDPRNHRLKNTRPLFTSKQ